MTLRLLLLGCLALVLHRHGFLPHEILGWVSVLVLAMMPERIG